MKTNKVTLCLTCAWRETCKKKYMLTTNNCPDYTEDLTLKKGDESYAVSKDDKRDIRKSK
jgi:hypothetical protein